MTDQFDQLQDNRKHNHFRIDDIIIDEYKLTPYEFTVYAIICRHANKQKVAWPGVRRIAERGSMSVGSVSKAINSLEKQRLIAIDRRTTKSGRGVNNYTILDVSSPNERGCSPREQGCSRGDTEVNTVEVDTVKDSTAPKNGADEPSTPTDAHSKENVWVEKVVELWDVPAARAQVLLSILAGKSKKHAPCNIEPPVTDLVELDRFARWYHKECDGCDMPKSPVVLQDWLYKFRKVQAPKTPPPAPVADYVGVPLRSDDYLVFERTPA